MSYQIVTRQARASDEFFVSETEFIELMGHRGYKYAGPSKSYAGYSGCVPREELWNKPEFEGLLGPMWNGLDMNGKPMLRYEDQGSYDLLST